MRNSCPYTRSWNHYTGVQVKQSKVVEFERVMDDSKEVPAFCAKWERSRKRLKSVSETLDAQQSEY